MSDGEVHDSHRVDGIASGRETLVYCRCCGVVVGSRMYLQGTRATEVGERPCPLPVPAGPFPAGEMPDLGTVLRDQRRPSEREAALIAQGRDEATAAVVDALRRESDRLAGMGTDDGVIQGIGVAKAINVAVAAALGVDR